MLWNRKAKKGIPLSKKMEFRNKHYSLDKSRFDDDSWGFDQVADRRAQFDASAVDLEDFTESQPDDVKKVINAVLKDPNILSKEGVFNHAAVRKHTGLSVHFAGKAINKLKKSLRKDYEV